MHELLVRLIEIERSMATQEYSKKQREAQRKRIAFLKLQHELYMYHSMTWDIEREEW